MAKILVIDDEASILNLMAKSCRQQGHDVTAVQTGREGIEALDKIEPELMIVDLLIGDMTGMEIITYGAEHHPDTKVIMVTGHGSIDTAVEAMRLGAFDYLTKPFELADLQRAVTLGLQKRDEEDQVSATDFQSAAISMPTVGMIGESPKVKEILLKTKNLKLIADHHQKPDSPPAWLYNQIWMEFRALLMAGKSL